MKEKGREREREGGSVEGKYDKYIIDKKQDKRIWKWEKWYRKKR